MKAAETSRGLLRRLSCCRPHGGSVQRLFIVACAVAVCACGDALLSARQKVVRDAHQAVCERRDILAMSPFLTDSSQPVLKLMGSMAELGKVFGTNPSDRLAVECQTGAGFEFLDEVRVNDARYIVRTQARGAAEATEYVLVQESGQWKIQLAGK